MSFVRLYGRVLDQLGPDRRVGWLLAIANVALAIALFAEPVLFGRVINVLAGAQANPAAADWPHLWLLLLAWVVLRPLHDRLRQRRLRSLPTGWRIAAVWRC